MVAPVARSPIDKSFSRRLLAWYDREHRELPWRGQTDPYRVWISEAMLQQTVVATVIPYYQRFLRAFPTVSALSQASESDVLRAWSGLGYYSRARSLKRAAEMVVAEFGGQLPPREEDLLRLPGVGPYTAAAVAAIAFGKVTFALDGNAMRVMSRVVNYDGFIEDETTKGVLRSAGLSVVPSQRSGDFAQAVMELGARVCVPRKPKCATCPVAALCRSLAEGDPATLPRRRPRKAKKPVRLVCVALLHKGKVLLQRRPSKGLLGGTWTLPSTEVADDDRAVEVGTQTARSLGVAIGRPQVCPTKVHHVFTHLDVWATVVVAQSPRVAKPRLDNIEGDTRWVDVTQVSSLPLASFTQKVLTCVQATEAV